MASVIQEGKMSAPKEGGLFQGQIFWLSHKVPQRAHIIQQIRMNGGTVVLNAKDAEICLVDHMRDKDEAMFSYEYVTKSTQAKKLEDLELHRTVPKRSQGTRPAASASTSAKPRLKGRNLFTQEDDDILLTIISEPGVKYNGAAIYKRIADEYPNHTMHSWRSRWVDQLAKNMPDGRPVAPKRKQAETKDKDRKENDEERIKIKREGEEFTEEDEAQLEKWADILALDPQEISIYERLNKAYPNHTAKQWRAHFTSVILPRLNRKKALQKSVKPQKRSTTESRGRHRDSEQQSKALNNEDKASPKPKAEIKPQPPTGSLDLKPKKQPSTPVQNSPIRTVNIRNRPNDTPTPTSKDKGKPPASHQQRKVRSSSPPHHPTTPIRRAASTVSSKASLSAISLSTVKTQKPSDHITRWRAEFHKASVAEDTDVGPIPPSSPPKLPSELPPTTQKRKRDSDIAPEQRKKSRNAYRNMGEIASTPDPESESPPRSRVLSPELLGSEAHHLASSPPLPKDNKKLRYAEMSTQAIYDQADADSLLEFPEIPGTPSSPPLLPAPSPSPRPAVQQNPSTPTKLLAPAPGSASKSPPLSPSKDDPDGIKEMNTFLAYCQKKYKTSEKQVIYAVERASGIKKLVELVLQSVVDDKPLPTDVPGIWSEEEDKVLMGADSREMKNLQEKKGAAHMEKRMDFLNLWNMA